MSITATQGETGYKTFVLKLEQCIPPKSQNIQTLRDAETPQALLFEHQLP